MRHLHSSSSFRSAQRSRAAARAVAREKPVAFWLASGMFATLALLAAIA